MPLTRFILTGALLAALGCSVIAPSGPSNVAQGRYYASGDPDYDDFFLKVYRLQIKLKDAPPRVGEPRQKVADALGVGPDPSDIRGALAKRASELKERGIRYTIGRPTSPDKAPTLLVTGNPTGKDFELKGLLDNALKSAGELKLDLTAWQKELDELSSRESTLDGNVGEAFANRSESQRTEVKNNLADAQKIISLLGERTHDLDVATTDFLKALTTALGETQVEAAPSESVADDSGTHEIREKKGKKPAAEKPVKASSPKASPAPKASPVPKASPAPKAPPPPKPKPAPAPKPAPPSKPAGGDEAPPKPKPTQGTAKPDFEP